MAKQTGYWRVVISRGWWLWAIALGDWHRPRRVTPRFNPQMPVQQRNHQGAIGAFDKTHVRAVISHH